MCDPLKVAGIFAITQIRSAITIGDVKEDITFQPGPTMLISAGNSAGETRNVHIMCSIIYTPDGTVCAPGLKLVTTFKRSMMGIPSVDNVETNR